MFDYFWLQTTVYEIQDHMQQTVQIFFAGADHPGTDYDHFMDSPFLI